MFVRCFVPNPSRNAAKLRDLPTQEEVRHLGREVAEAGGDQNRVAQLLESGEFLRYLPHVMSRAVRQSPELFLDNKLFALTLRNLPRELSEAERDELGRANASRIANLLEDLANAANPPRFELPNIERLGRQRAFVAIELLRELLVAI